MLNNKTVAVVIPAYNEEALIGKVLDAMPVFVDKIIVIDDGSTDGTVAIARRYGAIIVSHSANKGLGRVLQTGIAKALELRVDILVNIDGDNQFNPGDIERLIQPIISGAADLVTASRFKDRALYPNMSRIKFLGNKLIAYIVSKISGYKFYDVSCGFRAYSKNVLLMLNLYSKFTYTHESLLLLSFLGARMHEEPIEVKGTREFGRSKIASNVVWYGVRAIKTILQMYLDYEPFGLFMLIGLPFFLIFFLTGSFIFFYYFSTGFFTPYKWLGFVSGGALLIFLIFILMGFLLDSFAAIRRNQEKMLYFIKKLVFDCIKNE